MSTRTAFRLSALVRSEGHLQANSSPGRPPKATPQDDRRALRMLNSNPWLTFTEVGQELGMSRHRVSRVAASGGLFSYVARYAPILTPQHKADRLKWAQDNALQDWKKVIWTDESMVASNNAGNVRVIRPRNSAYEPKFTLEAGGQSRVSVMVWGAIGYDHKPPLVRFKLDPKPRTAKSRANAIKKAQEEGRQLHWTVDAEVYAEQILFDTLMPMAAERLRKWGEVWIVEDGATVHSGGASKVVREQMQIPTLDHPARSPDLNPIEHMWALVKSILKKQDKRAETEDELWEQIQAAWEAIPMEVVNRLVMSMEARRKEVIAAKGARTRY